MKSFSEDCFRHYILNYHGTPVIVEDYSWGDLGDDEVWGSFVYDFKNGKFLNSNDEFLDAYCQDPVETVDGLKDEWKIMDEIPLCQNNRIKKYYQKKIQELGDWPFSIIELNRTMDES